MDRTGKSKKDKPVVKYPTASNALRTLVVGKNPNRVDYHLPAQATHALRGRDFPVDQVPPKTSPPSADAIRLIAAATNARAFHSGFARDTATPPVTLRIEPLQFADCPSLGRFVRLRRQALNLSQDQLARLAGVGRRFIGDLEAGKPTVELGKVLRVCAAIQLTLTVQVEHG